MKKVMPVFLFVIVALFVGCATSSVQEDNDEAYAFIFANIDDSVAIQSYLEKEKSRGNDIDEVIKGGDTILMIAARYTNNIEVLKTIVSYFPSIHQVNDSNDMSALDYLRRREGTEEMERYLTEESVKYELKKKVNKTKTSIVKSLFSRI
jgi:hypothetical protein